MQRRNSNRLQAGAFKVDITPDIGKIKIQLGGYGARLNMPPKGVRDPIYARALVLKKGDHKLALVALDHLLVPASLTREVLKGIQATGIGSQSLFMAASHTHCAPDAMGLNERMKIALPGVGSFLPDFLSFTAEKVTRAILEADKRLQDADFALHAEAIPKMNRNRRGWKVTDPTMTVAHFKTPQGKTIACLTVYAAHPTIYGHTMMEVTAEFPGVLQNGLEKAFGSDAVALFMNGAQGDVSPEADEGKNDDERVQIYGAKLLNHAQQLLKKAKTQPDPMLSSVVTVSLPEPRPHPEFQESAGREYKIPEALLKTIVKQVAPPESPVSLAQIGSLLLMGYPGEPISELAIGLKQYAESRGYAHAAPVALVNDWVGYILTAEKYNVGGYEATVSFHGPDLGKTIEDAMKDAVNRLMRPR
ncbi:MAG: neutral/alkaline non-lysosomal ceramidase N-terminal domain-containing protein [Fimbriimonadia bacterium]|nr:neutral/alkaline non-lysosomal ceramidase N-terminal domain-containing protein [Fimbriimonadia bacterium]